MEKVAIVEFGGSHDECILSQLVALKEHGCHITFVCTEELLLRNPFFNGYLDEVRIVNLTGGALQDFRTMIRLNRFFQAKGVKKVVLNTAQGGHVRNLCLTANSSIEFIGIIHTLKKFQASFTQRLIDVKIRKYFVLNDFFLKKIEPTKHRKLASFYPLRFPHFEKQIHKPEGEIWITIIGGVETRRKDLQGSIQLMKNAPENYHFIFLGKSDKNGSDRNMFENEIERTSLTGRVKLFENFVNAEDFDAYLRATDLIWPMVHPNTPSADEYFRNQISGAINVAFSYKIPLLVHQFYADLWADLNSSVQYNLDSFQNDLMNGLNNREEIINVLVKTEKFSPVFQEKKYLNFVVGN
jgi:hypothetical protein